MKEIYLAGGCFWGVEHYFKQINGVIKTSVGYANGTTHTTNYKSLKETNHAETVYISYDDSIVTLEFLLDMYYKVIDPTSVNKQGEDEGAQYRTGIYYVDNNDLDIINKSINKLEILLNKKTVIEVDTLKVYCDAEEYHQNYLDKNPTGYCHISSDKFDDAKKVNR